MARKSKNTVHAEEKNKVIKNLLLPAKIIGIAGLGLLVFFIVMNGTKMIVESILNSEETPEDYRAQEYCGDGKCDTTESCSSCSIDCGKCSHCGDNYCNSNENC